MKSGDSSVLYLEAVQVSLLFTNQKLYKALRCFWTRESYIWIAASILFYREYYKTDEKKGF